MLVNEKKIIVCCAQSVTGGPELLHQLVHEIRAAGGDAHISYYPFNNYFECPEPYKKYDAPQCALIDSTDTFIIIPETATWIAKKLKHARIGIWWLSVDNYFFAKHQSPIRDLYCKYKSLISARLPLFYLRKYIHFTQSHYAQKFLSSHGISATPLTDYLSKEHLSIDENKKTNIKRNIIVFNPKKGLKQTKKLINFYKNISFIPIQDMTSAQVAELLRSAKIYIDFGNHPGKDRPPREAAMAGCCVVTGKKGSAAFQEDLSIPSKYKIDEKDNAYIEKFGRLVHEIFNDYSSHAADFEKYRSIISNEPQEFKAQVSKIFSHT